MTVTVDRPAAIRRALRDLVAAEGFHGTSMSAVAKAAGVATGTAYVHYTSKEELVYATYLEIKRDLGEAVLSQFDGAAPVADRYRQVMTEIYRHLVDEPERAKFLTQLEESPFHAAAQERLHAEGDALVAEIMREDFVSAMVDLPLDVTYALSVGIVVRLVAAGTQLSEPQLSTLINATWRAITNEKEPL